MKPDKTGTQKERSIFRSIFLPLFVVLTLQALLFYFAAYYGGIEESLSRNAADILSGRMRSRANELEAKFNSEWSNLTDCAYNLDALYHSYADVGGDRPLALQAKQQIQFLSDASATLIDTLRHNEVNGVFLILNDQAQKQPFPADGAEQKYGLCIRDMDTDSHYTDREDLLLERAPSSIVDTLNCSLDSWWEAKYTFHSVEDGDFYYQPLQAAWDNPGADGEDLAYLSGVRQISGSDPAMLCYSIPLLAPDGAPYGVLGVEILTRRLASLLPSGELTQPDKGCYALCIRDEGSTDCLPIVGSGALYARCFGNERHISVADASELGGYRTTARGVQLYGDAAQIDIYNNNNPFENRTLTLLALAEEDTLFAYISRVQMTLMIVALITMISGVAGIAFISRRFASPITALTKRVRGMHAEKEPNLGRVGVREIDLMVDAIEELNRDVSRNSARSDFFSRMSHDMRTPMNAIISFSSPEMLAHASPEEKDDYLSKIHASGNLLLALINEVLDMTKIESNKTELHREKLRANRLCETLIPIADELAGKKGVRFSSAIEVPDDVFVTVDAQHLNQIVMNLLSNAVKFTPEGGTVRFSLNGQADEKQPGRLLCRIVVADTGIGMSEMFLRKLYTPFEQESSSHGGTGLGLSIAKKLVELMGGRIACESRQNVGTTFTVDIPLEICAKEDSNELAHIRASAEDGASKLNGKHLLVCEDNNINTLIITRLLHTRGILTTSVTDGRQAVDAFTSNPPGAFDAILMDIRMPNMDGLTATRTIRSLPREDAAQIPIIAMTANAFDEDVQESHNAGMNAHLAKPVDIAKLFDTLLQLTSKTEPGPNPPAPGPAIKE